MKTYEVNGRAYITIRPDAKSLETQPRLPMKSACNRCARWKAGASCKDFARAFNHVNKIQGLFDNSYCSLGDDNMCFEEVDALYQDLKKVKEMSDDKTV